MIQNNRKTKFRSVRLLAALLVLASACLLTACTPFSSQPADLPSVDVAPFVLRPQNEKFFREDEWVRLITLAITHADYRDKIWHAIPAIQRAEISQTEFLRYVAFLSDCLPGSISSYYRASEDESAVIRGYAAKADKQLTPKPADASIWWIKARTSDLRELKFAIPVTKDESGIPCFSKSWLQKQAALYDYIILYLDALAGGSEPALSALLRHNTEIRSRIQSAAIDRRAKDLLAFYHDQVLTGKGSYRCLEMMPGRAVFEEQLLSADSRPAKTRTVIFTESGGRFQADENIAQPLKPDDTLLFFEGQPLFGPDETGAKIDSETALPTLGIPLNLEIMDSENLGDVSFRAVWPGMIVEASGLCDPDSLSFEGDLHQVCITYSSFETGTGLRPGDSVHELYLRYPFIRENGYMVQLQKESSLTPLAVQVESDYIAKITLIFD